MTRKQTNHNLDDAQDLPIFETTKDVSIWFDAAEAKLAPDDQEGRACLKTRYVQEIYKIYAKWEQELQQPISAEQKAELAEDLRLLLRPENDDAR